MCSQIENYHKLLIPKFKKKAQANTPGWLKGTIYFENNMHQKNEKQFISQSHQQMSSNMYVLALRERISIRKPSLFHAFMF